MNMVVDANVLFAALIKESYNYNLFFNDKFNFYTSEYIFLEFEKHKEEILRKTSRTTEEFYKLLEILKRKIIIVPLGNLANM